MTVTADTAVRTDRVPTATGHRVPVLAAAVVSATLAVSIAALLRPAVMALLVRDLPALRGGQWWRLVTPVVVQSSGWGQLGFNLAVLAVVGTAVERCTSRAVWVLVFVAGGVGSVAVLSALRPADGGGGTSDAVAALIGALAVLRLSPGPNGFAATTPTRVWPAQLFSVFFVGYLTVLDLGGVWPATLAGDASVALFLLARRVLQPATVNRTVLAVAGVGGLVMAGEEDGHGIGILAGATIAALVLARRRLLTRPDASVSRSWVTVATAVPATAALSVATWVAWTHLVGVLLAVARPGRGPSVVGWPAVGVVSGASCLLAWVAQQLIGRYRPGHPRRSWTILCVAAALASTAGPLTLGAGGTGRVGLVSLHVVCAAAVITLLTPPPVSRRGSGDVGASVTSGVR